MDGISSTPSSSDQPAVLDLTQPNKSLIKQNSTSYPQKCLPVDSGPGSPTSCAPSPFQHWPTTGPLKSTSAMPKAGPIPIDHPTMTTSYATEFCLHHEDQALESFGPHDGLLRTNLVQPRSTLQIGYRSLAQKRLLQQEVPSARGHRLDLGPSDLGLLHGILLLENRTGSLQRFAGKIRYRSNSPRRRQMLRRLHLLTALMRWIACSVAWTSRALSCPPIVRHSITPAPPRRQMPRRLHSLTASTRWTACSVAWMLLTRSCPLIEHPSSTTSLPVHARIISVLQASHIRKGSTCMKEDFPSDLITTSALIIHRRGYGKSIRGSR